MELKNKFSLSREEVAEMFENLAASLRNSQSFEIKISNQEVLQETSDKLEATLILSDTNFSLNFSWDLVKKKLEIPPVQQPMKPKSTDWRQKFDQDMADAGLVIKTDQAPVIEDSGISAIPVSSAESDPIIEVVKPEKVEAISSPIIPENSMEEAIKLLKSDKLKPRKLKDRMVLETTTLPYDGGVWSPSFSLSYKTFWTHIDINNTLENTKWISEEQIEALGGVSPRRPRSASSSSSSDDLFSDLDSTPKPSKIKSRKETASSAKKEIERIATVPAAMINKTQLEQLSILKRSVTQPQSSPPTLSSASLDSPVKQKKDPAFKVQEDMPLKEKIIQSIPDPKEIPSLDDGSIEEIEKEILEWKEPSRDEISTDDEWVKPSEYEKLKKKTKPAPQPPDIPVDKKKLEVEKKKHRPPPVAPDKKITKKGTTKKKSKKDKTKKTGWAKW